MISPTVEDYLKTIYTFSRRAAWVSTSSLAERLGLAPGSVTGMLKRLSAQGLVEHVPYSGVRLSEDGGREAIRMIRRHRILELFLGQMLGYTWDRVHAEAERLEHAASDEMIDRLAQMLGEPEVDPHGAPIPRAGQSFDEPDYQSLAELEEGCPAIVRRVSNDDPAALRYLAELELVPGITVEVLDRAPFAGPLRVRVGMNDQVLGRELARSLFVESTALSACGRGSHV